MMMVMTTSIRVSLAQLRCRMGWIIVAFQCFGRTQRDKGGSDYSYFEGYSWLPAVYWKAISDLLVTYW